MRRLKRTGYYLLFILLLSGCSESFYTIPVTSRDQLRNLNTDTLSGAGLGVSSIRLAALKETALSVGARAGLGWRSKHINQVLTKQSNNLDRIFNFNGVLLPHSILPPVLVEGRRSLNLDSGQAIRLADRTYGIARQAEFVTTAPSWRNYLWMSYGAPDMPDQTLLPKNKAEMQIWQKFVDIGWKKGVDQANKIYSENLARLRRDYQGMITYRKLLNQKMISLPFVTHTNLGVTGDSQHVRIDDQVLRITALPSLNIDSKQWHAVVISNDQP